MLSVIRLGSSISSVNQIIGAFLLGEAAEEIADAAPSGFGRARVGFCAAKVFSLAKTC
jgi:hypothetical protein